MSDERQGDRHQVALLLADQLERFAAGAITEPQLRAWCTPHASSFPVSLLWPEIERYLGDADVRARDRGHDAMQDSTLRQLITLLRHGASATELSRVSFFR